MLISVHIGEHAELQVVGEIKLNTFVHLFLTGDPLASGLVDARNHSFCLEYVEHIFLCQVCFLLVWQILQLLAKI